MAGSVATSALTHNRIRFPVTDAFTFIDEFGTFVNQTPIRDLPAFLAATITLTPFSMTLSEKLVKSAAFGFLTFNPTVYSNGAYVYFAILFQPACDLFRRYVFPAGIYGLLPGVGEAAVQLSGSLPE